MISLVSFSMISCDALFGSTAKLAKIENYTINYVEYTTADGVWTQETVSEMIDKYYYEQQKNVMVDVAVTITVESDFQYVDIQLSGGVRLFYTGYSGSTSYYETFGSKDMNDGMLRAGTYTFNIDDKEFDFYNDIYTPETGKIIASRDQIKMNVSAEVYKYYK